jgi:tetratricopeptide (TPR) repeat protein
VPDYPAALEYRRKEAAIFARIAALSPQDQNAQRNLALGHKYVAGLLEITGDPAGARELERQAIAIDKARVEQNPTNASAKVDLSFSYGALANNLRQSGDLEGALAAFQSALALAESMAAADPADAFAHTAAGSASLRVASLLLETNRPKESLAAAQRAVALQEELVRRDATNVTARARLANGLSQLAASHQALAAATPAGRAGHQHEGCAAAWSAEEIRLDLLQSKAQVPPHEVLAAEETAPLLAHCEDRRGK